MLWKQGRRSDNVEDRRDAGGGSGGPFGGGPMGRSPFPGGRAGGIGGFGLIAIVVIALFLGVDPRVLLQDAPIGQAPSPSSYAPRQAPPPRAHTQDELRDFVSVVLADTEDVWQALFRHAGRTYQEPKLVLFSGAVDSACGFARSAMGPFYCPGDQKVYIDLSFYDELKTRFRAPGDFAQAYVIAHEVGHHVQTLLGITQKVAQLRRQLSQADSNALSVRVELQADCFAGVWAHHAQRARQILEAGDIEEGLNAAAAIGDDRLQKQAQGYVVPESFTHGTAAQRQRWFRRGIDGGDLNQCNTFETNQL